jgi:radical SAM protein (TIGR01212 family)
MQTPGLKRYRDYGTYLRQTFGERVHKISLDAGLSCPNREGTGSRSGCIFCDRLGSGTGSFVDRRLSISEQITRAQAGIRRRYGARKFIVYFQSFTNTYGPLARLKELYDQAVAHPDVVGLSVATRPDCVDEEKLALLASYKKNHLVWIEYGLQSAHDVTLRAIGRGHDVACFERSVRMARQAGLDVCAHIILGLPGEDRDMMLGTARYLAGLPVQGVKFHVLYVTRGTPLAALHARGAYVCMGREVYVDLLVDLLEVTPPGVIIQRLVSDAGGADLLAPSWVGEKSKNLACIHARLERRNTWQGRLYPSSRSLTSHPVSMTTR